jgi:uncharacterized protein
MLSTDFYFQQVLNTPKPVLVFRGCSASSGNGNFCNFWPEDGLYHIVAQDIRGSPGCSNTPTPFIGDLLYKYDQDDGHTLLGYINGELWGSSGHLAMEGWSNGGIVSYLAAVNAGPYLRGIQTHYATGDLLNYGLFNGGVQHKEILYPVDLPQAPNQISWKDYVGLGIWDKYLITDSDAGRANVAGLHVGGWFDVFGQGILDTSSRMQTAVGNGMYTKQKVVIGPWVHAGDGGVVGQIPFPNFTPSNPSLADYNAKWKNAVFKGGSADWNAWNALPVVKVYLMNADPGSEWLTYTTWPPPGVKFHYYFTSTNGVGGLSGVAPTVPGQLTFTSDPSSPCPTLGGTNNLLSCVTASPVPCGPWDQRPIEAREHDPAHQDVVVFTSDLFANAGETVGRMHADVWIQTDLPDVDVVVRMTDVYPDGRSMLMAQGIQRARYRNGGACPVLPLDLTPPTKVRVDMSSTALVVRAQHKVRVIVSASAGPNQAGNPPFVGGYSVNPQNGQEYIGLPNANKKGTIKVLTGGRNASELVLSVPGGQNPQPDERPPKPTPCPP